MGTNNCGINKQLFQIRLVMQGFRHAVPNTIFFPTGEAHIHGVPVAEFLGQVTPRAARAYKVQNGFDKATVIRCSPTFICWLAW